MINQEQTTPAQKPEKDEATLAIENNPCGLCRAMLLPICRGHGGSGGGGGGSEGKAAELKIISVSAIKPGDIFFKYTKGDDGAIKVIDDLGNGLSEELAGELLLKNFKELFKQQLEINSNHKDTLSIEIKAAQKEVLQEFLKLLKDNCDTLVLAEQEKNPEYRAEIKENTLTIFIPDNTTLFQKIVKSLSENSLSLYKQAEENVNKQKLTSSHQEKKETLQSVEENKQKPFNPTPFSTRLERKEK